MRRWLPRRRRARRWSRSCSGRAPRRRSHPKRSAISAGLIRVQALGRTAEFPFLLSQSPIHHQRPVADGRAAPYSSGQAKQERNAVTQAGFVVPKYGLDTLGLKNLGTVHWNLTVPALYEEAIRRGEGQLGEGGAFVVRTGVHTGRSPNDKFFVDDSVTHNNVDWGKTNKPISPERYRALY